MAPVNGKMSERDPMMEHLDEKIAWYDGKSLASQRAFKRMKAIEILIAALIPLLAALDPSPIAIATGVLGVLVTVLEGTLHLNQYQQNWINYRSTCESLKYEKYIYLAQAPPYANAPNPYALLTERIGSLLSQENIEWTAVQRHQADTPKMG